MDSEHSGGEVLNLSLKIFYLIYEVQQLTVLRSENRIKFCIRRRHRINSSDSGQGLCQWGTRRLLMF